MAWTTKFTDLFTGTTGTRLTAYNPDWIRLSSTDYLAHDSSGYIYRDEGASWGRYYWNGTIGADQAAEIISVNSSTRECQANVRMSGTVGNWSYYALQWNGTSFYLGRFNDTTWTNLWNATGSLSSGDKIRLEVTGTGATVTLVAKKYSGGSWSTLQTYEDTSASRLTSGKPGLATNATAGAIDTFQADEWGDAPGTSLLEHRAYTTF